jgi:outer membrane protein assembly factor BamB
MITELHGTWTTLSLKKKIRVAPQKSRSAKVVLPQPLVGSDGVYVADHWEAKKISKLDRRTLKEVWRVPGIGERCWPYAMWSDNLVLVQTVKPGDYGLCMLDGGTGRFLWEADCRLSTDARWRDNLLRRSDGGIELIDPLSGKSNERIPVSYNDAYIYLQCGSHLVLKRDSIGSYCGFDLETRRVLWERDLAADIGARVQASDRALTIQAATSPDVFVVTPRAALTCGFSIVNGECIWQAPVAMGYFRADVHDGRLYGQGAVQGGSLGWEHFISVHERTGEVVYAKSDPLLRSCFYPKPGTFYAGRMAIAHESGDLAVFDLATGLLVWHEKLKVSLWGTAEADGRLLVTAGDGNLLVFEDK